MEPDSDPKISANLDADLTEVLRHLDSGERTASALESNLDNLEQKIEELLAAVEDRGAGEDEKAGSPPSEGKESDDGNITSNGNNDASDLSSSSDAQVKPDSEGSDPSPK